MRDSRILKARRAVNTLVECPVTAAGVDAQRRAALGLRPDLTAGIHWFLCHVDLVCKTGIRQECPDLTFDFAAAAFSGRPRRG